MRIAFDGEMAARDSGSRGKDSRVLIASLAGRFPDSSFDVYIRGKKENVLLKPLLDYPNVRLCRPEHPVLRHFPALWERFGMARELKRRGTDVFHGLDDRLPCGIRKSGAVRSAVSVHDLSFLSGSRDCSWLERHRLNIRVRSSVRKADIIVASSDDTARDVVKYYFIPKQKIAVPCPEGSGGDRLADKMMEIYRGLAGR